MAVILSNYKVEYPPLYIVVVPAHPHWATNVRYPFPLLILWMTSQVPQQFASLVLLSGSSSGPFFTDKLKTNPFHIRKNYNLGLF